MLVQEPPLKIDRQSLKTSLMSDFEYLTLDVLNLQKLALGIYIDITLTHKGQKKPHTYKAES